MNNSDSNTRVMKENKAMTHKILKMSILLPKTFKDFYHHIKFRKSIINRKKVFYKKAILKTFSEYYEILKTPILKNNCEQLLLRVFPVLLV